MRIIHRFHYRVKEYLRPNYIFTLHLYRLSIWSAILCPFRLLTVNSTFYISIFPRYINKKSLYHSFIVNIVLITRYHLSIYHNYSLNITFSLFPQYIAVHLPQCICGSRKSKILTMWFLMMK